MFTTLVTQPIFNLLVLIYILLPGHNFGVAIIIFTIIVRMLMWPLVKKQVHNAKAMRELQPEIKKIKKAANGDKQKESAMMMELYKERKINPLGSLGIVILQLPILIGLYSGINKVINDPKAIYDLAYPVLQNSSWLKQLVSNIDQFDSTLLGFIDLTKSALGPTGVYWPAMMLVLGSAFVQYYQSKQLMPNDKDARKLRDILKGAGQGQKADQSEVNAAVGRSTRFIIPVMIFFLTVNIASALSLYWLVSGIIAIIQQNIALKTDKEELEASAARVVDSKDKAIEGEVIRKKTTPKSKKSSSKKGKKSKKRR